jgi:hypothetical protein
MKVFKTFENGLAEWLKWKSYRKHKALSSNPSTEEKKPHNL